MLNLGHASTPESAYEQHQSDNAAGQTCKKHKGEMQNGEHTATVSKQNAVNGSFEDAYDPQDFRYLGYTDTAGQQSSAYNFVSDSKRVKRHHYESSLNNKVTTPKKIFLCPMLGKMQNI